MHDHKRLLHNKEAIKNKKERAQSIIIEDTNQKNDQLEMAAQKPAQTHKAKTLSRQIELMEKRGDQLEARVASDKSEQSKLISKEITSKTGTEVILKKAIEKASSFAQ